MDFLDEIWKKRPELIRQYYDLLPKHERLCSEIEYILRSGMENANVEIAHITSRPKTLKSFCEKVHRKSYVDPLKEITDLAGVRIVFLYISDIEEIQQVVEQEFEIVEKENKLEANDKEKFGYGALHYLVKIKKKHSGARYDDLRNLVCEIQVRTILQDAWSVVAHHLSYKQERDVPKKLIRKLNALSGLFETADDQFESLRLARNEYKLEFEKNLVSAEKKSLSQSINLDNLTAYLATKFPERAISSLEDTAELLEELKEYRYLKLSDIERLLETALPFVYQEESKFPPSDTDIGETTIYESNGLVRISLSLTNEQYCKNMSFGDDVWERAREYGLHD